MSDKSKNTVAQEGHTSTANSGRVQDILRKPNKPTGGRLNRLIFMEAPAGKDDVDALFEYGEKTKYANKKGAWSQHLMGTVLNELWNNPENNATLAWAEALIEKDLEGCSKAVLNGETIRNYQDAYKYSKQGLGEYERAAQVISQLWAGAMKQFKVPEGGLRKALKLKRLSLEENIVGLSIVGQWIGFKGTPRPYDIRRVSRVHDALGHLENMGASEDDFRLLGAYLRHARLGMEIDKQPTTMPSPGAAKHGRL